MPLKRCACGKEDKQKCMKRLNKEWFCSKCYAERRKKHRRFLKRDILHIKKRRTREEIERDNKLFPQNPPKMKGEKVRKISRGFHFYLTIEEKQVLFQKYHKLGLDSKEIKEKLKQDAEYLKNYMKKLKVKEKSKEELNRKFKEEFAKLCMQS